jgi:uncharacterized protein
MAKCPVCGKDAPARAVNRAFPFCSERCKLVDLGKWLGEEYRIPVRAPQEDDGEVPLAPGPDREGGGRHDA